MLKNLKISAFHKFAIGLSISLLILLIAIVFAWNTSNKLYENFNWVEHTYRVIETVKNIQVSLTQAESDSRGYYVSRDPDLYLLFKEAVESRKKSVDSIQELISNNPKQQKNIKHLRILLTERMILLEKTFDPTFKISQKYTNEVYSINHKIKALLLLIEIEERNLLKERQTTAYINLSKSKNMIIFSGILALIISGLIVLVIRRDFKRQENHEKELKALDENKNKFFSIIGHDLRGGVGRIIAITRMMINPNFLFEKNRDLLPVLNATAKNTQNLLEDLLTWSKSQMNQITFTPEKITIEALINTAVSNSVSASESKNIKISRNLQEDLHVLADREMINTVLRNLLQNAIKFTREGGEIILTAKIKGKYAVISVKDNGIGIPQNFVTKIFKIEEGYSSKGTNNEKGTGLGLILCKDFITKNNGEIWLQSSENKGTTFSFSLPLA